MCKNNYIGPDHLAALLPRCMGQRWYNACKVGALWGMGHGISATILGMVAFAIKRTALKRTITTNNSVLSTFLLSKASNITELAIGISLIFIGFMGMKEAKEWSKNDNNNDDINNNEDSKLTTTKSKSTSSRAVLFNGILHGFSWDGAPSLAPSLIATTWYKNILFLSSYALGTMIIMSIVTTIVGEGTRRASQILNNPNLPQKLSYISSIIAISIGIIWCILALK